jgi:hypothetical protein
MIAFGVTVAEPEAYHRYAEKGIRVAAEPDSQVFAFATAGTVGRGANLLLDAAASLRDLEALVILHPHTEIADPQLCDKVRAALADPNVAVAGCAGATGVHSIAWWDGQVSAGEIVHRYNEHGGGELPAYSWTKRIPPPATVEAVDGFLLALSPWAVRNVRFDEGLHLGFGFDVDYCLQVRAQGRLVVTFDARVIQHRSVELIETIELWVEAHIAFAQKWDEQLLGEQDLKARARRAEAEREAARTITYFRRLSLDARVEQLEKAVAAATSTRSWRATQPLRDLNAWRRSRRARSAQMR